MHSCTRQIGQTHIYSLFYSFTNTRSAPILKLNGPKEHRHLKLITELRRSTYFEWLIMQSRLIYVF